MYADRSLAKCIQSHNYGSNICHCIRSAGMCSRNTSSLSLISFAYLQLFCLAIVMVVSLELVMLSIWYIYICCIHHMGQHLDSSSIEPLKSIAQSMPINSLQSDDVTWELNCCIYNNQNREPMLRQSSMQAALSYKYR